MQTRKLMAAKIVRIAIYVIISYGFIKKQR
jgi:hypothetical protein